MNGDYVVHFAVLIVLLLILLNFSIGEECDASGKKCISCTDYQKCSAGVPIGEIYSCKDGAACADRALEECRLKLNCVAGNECLGAGIFPDAMDESNFYVCIGDPFLGFIMYEFTCQEEYYFDWGSSSCVPKAVTSTDTIATPETSSETTTVVTSPSTSETTPTTTVATSTETTISTAATSTETTISTAATSTETTISTAATSTETTISTAATTLEPTLPSTTPETTTVPTTTTSPPITCTLSGIFPFPSNCKMYYRCSTSLKAFYYVCPGASYFNENILKCSMTISPACQEQILKNTTTATTSTPQMTTSPTTATTIPPPSPPTTTAPLPSPPPPTTTLSTPSTAPPAPTPTSSPGSFSCPSAGTFANTVNCKTYFRCSTTGNVFVFTCPGESYFNEFTGRCSMVMTPRCQQLLQV